MKKYLVLTVALVLGASFAFAGTLCVPFYRDLAGNFTSDASPAGFVGIKNTTDNPILLTFQYTSPEGADLTPEKRTYRIQARQGVGFRPVQTDPTAEGPEGVKVPNATASGYPVGSLTITWSGGNTDVVGRYTELFTANSAPASYLLPTLQ